MNRRTLRRMATAAVALLLATVVAAGGLVAVSQPEQLPGPELLPIPDDTPLMTDEAKALALEDGVGAYWWFGRYYVNHNLPAEYWLE